MSKKDLKKIQEMLEVELKPIVKQERESKGHECLTPECQYAVSSLINPIKNKIINTLKENGYNLGTDINNSITTVNGLAMQSFNPKFSSSTVIEKKVVPIAMCIGNIVKCNCLLMNYQVPLKLKKSSAQWLYIAVILQEEPISLHLKL